MSPDVRDLPALPERLRAALDGDERLDRELLRRAYSFARERHADQRRATGEPFVEHPVDVACILAEYYRDTPALAAALLHDTVEDTDAGLSDVKAEFGEAVGRLVDGLTKITRMELPGSDERQVETYRKLLLSTAGDGRVLLVKLADRLHNMRTLEALEPDARRRIARETREIYAPLAHRLGMQRIKAELEDLAFKHLEPDRHRELARQLEAGRAERERQVDAFRGPVGKALAEAGIEAEIQGRAKHLWSLDRKMRRRGVPLEEVHDALAVRVIVPSVEDCYHALGILHNRWTPLTDQFDDYIANPKSNLYQSLHTVVFGPEDRRYEVQIRTRRMHETAEYGIAAHWRYKEGGETDEVDEKLTWFRRVLEWQRETESPEEFLEYLKIDLFQDEIFVFTPRGDVQELPRGATALDFAFAVHTEVGLQARGARVNGHMRALDHELESGDTVEVLTDDDRSPSRDWLEFVRTSKARHQVRKWLRDQNRERHAARGREKLRRLAEEGERELTDGALASAARELGLDGPEALLAQVGRGDLGVRRALRAAVGPLAEEAEEAAGGGTRAPAATDVGVRIAGMEGLEARFAQCCQPVPGDEVAGYVTRGRGVSVHRTGCGNLRQMAEDGQRLVDVQWAPVREGRFPARIRFAGRDRPGLLAEVARAVSATETNIESADVDTSGGRARGELVVSVADRRQLGRVLERVKRVSDVEEARRVGTVRG